MTALARAATLGAGALAALALGMGGAWGYLYVSDLRSAGVTVLTYHRLVADEAAKTRWDLPVNRFVEHLDYLSDSGYSVIGLDEVIAHRDSGRALPPKPVLLTFDDGTGDHYRIAYPLLRERGLPAAFFVTTSWLNGPISMRFDDLREMAARGMTIGAHSHTHPYNPSLRELENEQILDELWRSKTMLEDSLGGPVPYMSVPRGWYDDRTLKMADSLGYLMVLTSDVGRNPLPIRSTSLRRVAVDGRGQSPDFARSLRPRTLAWNRLVWICKGVAYRLFGPRLYEAIGSMLAAGASSLPLGTGLLVATLSASWLLWIRSRGLAGTRP